MPFLNATQLIVPERQWLWSRLIILNLLGGCLLWEFRHQVIAHDWRQTQGTIVSIEAIDQDSANGGGGIASTRCMIVSYRYTVNGESYRGTRFQPSGICLQISPTTMAHPPIGRTLTVWYDARDPDFAVLKKDQAFEGIWIWCLLLLLIVIGNGAFVEHARRRAAGWTPGGGAA